MMLFSIPVLCIFVSCLVISRENKLLLDVSSITPTKHTLFIYYIYIPCFSYMFRCISYRLQLELTYSLLKTICLCTVV
jgi:hypothetical protein